MVHNNLQSHCMRISPRFLFLQQRHRLEDEHRLLVYEFMPRGSLENHLFRRGSYFQPLSWNLRMKVALGAAKGLAFLHSSKTKVIYRDFKTSNILLDSNYNAKLSDFGLAKDGPTGDKSHVSTRVMGTYGYAAPEYLDTGHRRHEDPVEFLKKFQRAQGTRLNLTLILKQTVGLYNSH
ncbi:hypothetical protein L3X38_010415 [Prunus dulcis]|uniref:non-specific serine/threonine protein kinase n=1 Tax=Prunus dulcis TaxID=3755 RepID=A0AAD4WFK3_PRUDU|nr:hypothetical protein L3X38_010415 [Prunus dulcis]